MIEGRCSVCGFESEQLVRVEEKGLLCELCYQVPIDRFSDPVMAHISLVGNLILQALKEAKE